MASLLKHGVARRLKFSFIALVLAFFASSAGDAQAVCSVANGACGGSAATCSAGSVTGDNGQTSCGTTRSWGCMGTGGGTTASCSVANAACCSPNWQVSGYGSCNASCGNYGSQSVTMTDYACGGGSYQTSQSCYGGACCTPSWYVSSYGSCSRSCGGGTQTVYNADGCGGSYTSSQSCNTQACTAPCSGWGRTIAHGGVIYVIRDSSCHTDTWAVFTCRNGTMDGSCGTACDFTTSPSVWCIEGGYSTPAEYTAAGYSSGHCTFSGGAYHCARATSPQIGAWVP